MSETGTGTPPGNYTSPADAFEQLLAVEDGETEQPQAEVQDEGEEVEEVTDGESEAEDTEDTNDSDEDAEEAPEQAQTFRVKVGGEEVEVPLEELIKGYSRTADYTRKTQAVSQARKEAESELAQAREERQRYAATLQALNQQLQAMQPPEVDWDKLYQENPVEWMRQRELARTRQEQQAWVQSQQQALLQRQQIEEQEQQSKTLETERDKLLDALPEWRDSDKARAEKAKIVEYATGKLGFTAEEISDIFDARAVVALRKAMLFDELQSKREQMRPTIKQKAKPMRAGNAVAPQSAKNRASKDALSKLAKTGSTRDAASVFAQFID
jgi:hypothetical protein